MPGLGGVLPTELLPLFTAAELDELMCGRTDLDVDLLRRHTVYEFVQPGAPHVAWLWEVLAEAAPAQRAAFFNFVTARSRMPASADGMLQPMKIEGPPAGRMREAPDGFHPEAKTCFSTLTLPPYSSKAALREKLFYAIAHATTMDADVNRATEALPGFE